MLQKLSTDVKMLSLEIMQDRISLRNSEEYISLKEELKELLIKQTEINATIRKMEENTKIEEYKEKLSKLKNLMLETGNDEYDDFKLKYSTKNNINTKTVFNLIPTDKFIKLSKITQKDLKDYIKESGDDELSLAIEVTRTVSGVSFPEELKV